MIESFVDLTYRGIELARRVKLTAVTSGDCYLEVATPMPVGTEVAISTDERVHFTAQVSEIHEQIAGAAQAPGMRVVPTLLAADAQSWWSARLSMAVPPAGPAPKNLAPVQTTPTQGMATVSEPAPAIDLARVASDSATTPTPRRSAEILAQVEAESLTAAHEIVDDGRRTVTMDAVDPALLEQLLNGDPTMGAPAMGGPAMGGPATQNESEPEPDSGHVANSGNETKKKPKRSKGR